MREAARALRAASLPPPQVNVLVHGEQGIHEVDCFWPSQRLVVELDSFTFHRTRRDHKRDASTNADLDLAGYQVLRLTWDDVVVHGERTRRRFGRYFPTVSIAPLAAGRLKL